MSLPSGSRKRRRGLWKGHTKPSVDLPTSTPEYSDAEHDEPGPSTLLSGTSKRRKRSDSPGGADTSENNDLHPNRDCPSRSVPPVLTLAITSIMEASSTKPDKRTANATSGHEDWEDLKELFAKAVEHYESLSCPSLM
jgi:hypothetical protein